MPCRSKGGPRAFWWSACLVTLTGLACRGSAPMPPATAVVLISIDTLRADRLNAYGYRQRTVSPNIDALARDGILFENTFSASPWTMPSHFSIMTALYPARHGMLWNFGDPPSVVGVTGGIPSLPRSVPTLAERLDQAGFSTAAFTGGAAVDRRLGFGRGFESYGQSMFRLGQKNMSELLGYVEESRNRRFFLFWHHYEMHAPYVHADFLSELESPAQVAAFRELAERFTDVQPELAGGQAFNDAFTTRLKELGIFDRDACDALYVAGVKVSDTQLGRLIGALKQNRLYDSTLLIVTSDHGEELGDHDPARFYNQHGMTLYDEILHVPLIIKLPGQRWAGTRVAALSRTVDIAPTILDLLGLGPFERPDGASLRPLWEGQAEGGRLAYSEGLIVPAEKKAVRNARFKYVVSMAPETVLETGRRRVPDTPALRELFDTQADPREQNNLLDLKTGPPLDPDAKQAVLSVATRLEGQLRQKAAAAPPITTPPVALEDETWQRLEALGYVQHPPKEGSGPGDQEPPRR